MVVAAGVVVHTAGQCRQVAGEGGSSQAGGAGQPGSSLPGMVQ